MNRQRDESDLARRSRRSVLASAAGALVVAGCSTYDANNGGVNGPPPSTAGNSSAGGSGAASGGTASGSGSAPASNVLAPTSAVPVGGGDILAAQKIVITQPVAGTFKAFTAVCTHQGCIVGTVANGTIQCPCHGSAFSIKDGSVVNGPAASPLAPVAIKVEGTSIVAG